MQQNTKYIKEQMLPANSLPSKRKLKKKNLDISNAKEKSKPQMQNIWKTKWEYFTPKSLGYGTN